MTLVSSSTATLKQNYHQTFEVRKDGKTIVRHTLLLNPQNLSQTEQARTTVTQTLGGAYVVDFGAGLPVVTISGTTGYKLRANSDGELRDGYQEFKHFRNEVYRRFINANDPGYEMFWYNWEDEEYWNIQPTSFRLQRSVSEPLLYRYELTFTCIASADVTLASSPDSLTRVPVDFGGLGNDLALCISNITEGLTAFTNVT